MKDIKFNYGSMYDKGGQQMKVVTLESIDIHTISKDKNKQPCKGPEYEKQRPA